MKEDFRFILDNYETFYANQRNDSNKSLDQNMKNTIKEILPGKIQSQLSLDEKKYEVVGSIGIGNYTETPWISIFEKSITKGAQKGFYVVFLFTKDMTGVYLSLNQGTTYLNNKFKGNSPRLKMVEVADKLRREINLPLNKFPEINIDLNSNTENARNYSSANICAKFYSFDNLPEDNVFLKDIENLLLPLNEIKQFIGLRNLDEVVDDLISKDDIEDVKYQDDVLFSNPAKTERKPMAPPEKNRSTINKSWTRNAAIAKESLKNASYCCEIDENHMTFKSSVTKRNYVEAHHIIPLSQQDKFEFSVDVPGNIVALCPNCHREIHHAEDKDKKRLFKMLFHKRQEDLKEFGLHLNINELFYLNGL